MAEKTVLGIDLRVCSVKVVELRKDPCGYSLLGFGMEEIPYELLDKHPDKEIAQINAIKKIISDKNFKSTQAFVVISGNDVLVKRLSMSSLSSEEIHQAIKWKIKDEFPFPIEEAVVEFQKIQNTADQKKSDFVVAATHKSSVDRIVDVVTSAGLKIKGIIPLSFGLLELYREKISNEGVSCVIYIGKRTTNMTFFRNGQICFNREMFIGGEDITKAMTSAFVSGQGRIELNYEEAEKIKQEQGIPMERGLEQKIGKIDVQQLYALVRPALEKVEKEISRTIEYFKNQEGDSSIEKVVLTGGSSRTPHFAEFLSEGLGVKVEVIDPIEKINLDIAFIPDRDFYQKAASQLSGAIGASLYFDVLKGIDLTPDEYKNKLKNTLKKHLNSREAFIALALLLSLYYGFMMFIDYSVSRNLDERKIKLNSIKPKLTRLEELEKAMREEEGRRGVFKRIELSKIKIPDILEGISKSIPDQVMVESLEFNEILKEVKIKGVAFERGGPAEKYLSKFMLDLSKEKNFEKVELVEAVKASGYTYDAFNFEILCKARNLE